MRLETERLFLREMTREDFDALYVVLGSSDGSCAGVCVSTGASLGCVSGATVCSTTVSAAGASAASPMAGWSSSPSTIATVNTLFI